MAPSHPRGLPTSKFTRAGACPKFRTRRLVSATRNNNTSASGCLEAADDAPDAAMSALWGPTIGSADEHLGIHGLAVRLGARWHAPRDRSRARRPANRQAETSALEPITASALTLPICLRRDGRSCDSRAPQQAPRSSSERRNYCDENGDPDEDDQPLGASVPAIRADTKPTLDPVHKPPPFVAERQLEKAQHTLPKALATNTRCPRAEKLSMAEFDPGNSSPATNAWSAAVAMPILRVINTSRFPAFAGTGSRRARWRGP
jgi:hypothetical protein